MTCFTSHSLFWKIEYIQFNSMKIGNFYRLFRKDGVRNIFEIPFLMSFIPEGRTSFLILASRLANNERGSMAEITFFI